MTPRPRVLLGAVTAFGAALAISASCSVYPDSLLEPGSGASGGGSGAGGSTGGSAGAVTDGGIEAGNGFGFWSGTDDAGCVSVGVPTSDMRPAPGDTTEISPIYFGITKLYLGSQDKSGNPNMDAWMDYGLDLDGLCTLSATCSADMNMPANACKPATNMVPFDGNDCRDNTFGRFEGFVAGFKDISQKYRLSDDAFNCSLCAGRFNFLIKLSHYNGQANDDQVRVDAYPSPGLETPLGVNCSDPNDTSWKVGLCWLGNDPFLVEDDSVQGTTGGPDLSDAKLFDDHAYVRDGYAIVQFPEALFWFPTTQSGGINSFPLRMQKAIIVAKIAKASDGTWSISEGTISGRAKGDDIVTAFREVGFCESDPLYMTMLNYVKSGLDLLASGVNDPTMPCDALSVGVGFEAKAATPGKLAPVQPLVECQGSAGAGGSGGSGGSAGAGGSGGSAGM